MSAMSQFEEPIIILLFLSTYILHSLPKQQEHCHVAGFVTSVSKNINEKM